MRNLVLCFLLLTVSVGLTGCATPLTGAQKDNVNNVAAIAVYNDTLSVAYIGTTVFSNTLTKVDVSSWGLDSIVDQAMKAGLESVGKTYKPVPFDRQKISAAIESGNTALNRLAGTQYDALNDYLFSTAASHGAQYLFVFLPVRLSRLPEPPEGLGLYCRSFMGLKGDWEGTSVFSINLWDLTTKENIYSELIRPRDTIFSGGKPCDALDSTTPEKFAALFMENFRAISQDSATLALKNSGLLAK